MKTQKSELLSIAIIALLSYGFTARAENTTAPRLYAAQGEIPFGGQGGWDYVSIDAPSRKLFVSHSDRVIVIDIESRKILGEVTDTQGVHGIAVASEFGKGYASNGKENRVSVFDLVTLKTKSKIKVGQKPDAIIYAPDRHEVYAFNGKDQSASVIDTQNDNVVATVHLPGKPESAVADAKSHRVFVNIEDKNSLVAIDTNTHKIAATWKIEGCDGPGGLAIDLENHRLFSACDNEKMFMLDSASGKILSSAPTGEGTDAAAFDQELRLAFASNGKDGSVTIAKVDASGQLKVIENLKTQTGARTMALDAKTHRIFLPTALFHPAEKAERPKPIDGSQKILVYGL